MRYSRSSQGFALESAMALAGMLLMLVSCTQEVGESGPGLTGTANQEPTHGPSKPTEGVPARHPLEIFRDNDIIMLAEIQTLDSTYEAPDPHVNSVPPPTWSPKYKYYTPGPLPPQPAQGVFTVKVLRLISGTDVAAGELLTILSDGETLEATFCEDSEGCGLGYRSSGEQVLEPGGTYLLVLEREAEGPGELRARAFARLAVGDSGLLGPVEEAWADFPPIAALTGLTVNQAAEEIADFLATPRPAPLRY